MVWHDLLMAHWSVAPDALRQRLPGGLELDLFESPGEPARAYLAVVPFTMTGVRPRLTPPLPKLSAFHELNVRTYVRAADGTRGVYFFSLDAANALAVEAARAIFHLNYLNASMSMARAQDSSIAYRSARKDARGAPAAFEATYAPTGPASPPAPGSLEHWLVERYRLFAVDPRGQAWRGEIHHASWPLQPARAEIATNTMADALGIELAGEPLLHFASRVDVVAWLPVRVRALTPEARGRAAPRARIPPRPRPTG